MNKSELLALGASADLQTACRALGIGKSTGYVLASKGEFPCRVIRVGTRYIVPNHGPDGLFALLGIEAA
ncbi:DNA-binding protein [Rhodococcus sp. D2-41]|uniref:DNA-binding protein n=1 Tax=Speluncibacter jeojiensis TaxID=2710754 RepID=UPI0024105748|nr:DNA-binding protein [Rhodococcus sp. D2-41]MDG3012412.1 DNA-binding protein [Rhodococcus sp. D2-41]